MVATFARFLSDPGILGVQSMGPGVSNWQDPFEDLTDVTLADEDTNSILADNDNRAIQGNVAMQVTACLTTQKWFLGVDGTKKRNIFLKLFFLGHTYTMTKEFTWTKCEPHLNWNELNKSFNFFIYFLLLTPDFGIKCQFCNLSLHTSIFVQLDSPNMMNEPPEYEVSYLWTFSTVPSTTIKTFTF